MSRGLLKNLPVIVRSRRLNSPFLITRQQVRNRNQGRPTEKDAPTTPPLKFCIPDENSKLDKLFEQSDIYHRLMAERHSTALLKRLLFTIPTDIERFKKEKGSIKISKQEYKFRKNIRCPPCPNYQQSRSKAITVDCEMADGRNGMEEVVSICIVDVIRGRVLLNSLVKPRQRIFRWRSQVHGIDESTYTEGTKALGGWQEARSRLFSFIDSDTVIVGHAVQTDLKSLRIAHDNIVDTAVLTSQAVFGTKSLTRYWSLKTLCAEFLGMRIQTGSKHSALEDAMATREVVLWCIYNPDKMHEWGSKQKELLTKKGMGFLAKS